MKVEKKVWIGRGKSAGNSVYLYDEKLSAGKNGVYVGGIDEFTHYPLSDDMIQLHDKELQILGIDIQPGQVIELTVTYDKPRPMGWYRCKVSRSDGRAHSRMILWYDGVTFRQSHDNTIGALWQECEFSWISDNPIPDPFEGVQ